MKKEFKCIICNKEIQSKNEIGINKKFFGEDISNFYCIECLASDLEVEINDIYNKIEEFKAEGCKLFE